MNGVAWITSVGAGIFLMYMPIGCTLYDRLLGAAHEQLTTTLLSIIQDAGTTLGTTLLLLYKLFVWPSVAARNGLDQGAAQFFSAASLIVGSVSALLLLVATFAFNHSVRTARLRGGERADTVSPLRTARCSGRC
ncbi:hypothetical protein T492DRAFT_340699 [Pavlovales sp. CCMP2436]|nr:hypothetical protein T492DRAFT_340699 [Pavlovales sp. CCMP2436]